MFAKRNQFPAQPYFPCLLGNGVDSVLLDYSGSMGCDSGHLHTEQHQGVICAWYKATHVSNARPLPPLLRASYTLHAAGGEVHEVGEFEQRLDPQRAVLTTLARGTDFRLELTAFLTREHVLVEHYRLLSIPSDRPMLALNLLPPVIPWANHYYTLRAAMSHTLIADASDATVRCYYDVDGTRGEAIMYVDVPASSEESFMGGKRLLLEDITPGMSLTRYVIALDEKDDPDYRFRAEALLEQIKARGYEAILAEHEREWIGYSSRNRVELPDKWLQYLYQQSLHLVRAAQNPYSGLISMGNCPPLWDGATTVTWDCIFPHTALLGANRLAEATRLVDGYAGILPLARHYASRMGEPGAYYAWCMNYRGESMDFHDPTEFTTIEKWNNGCLVMEVWNLYLYTGDRGLLARYWPVMHDTCAFLASSLVEVCGDAATIKECMGADETINRMNDTLHCVTTMKALEALGLAAAILGKSVSFPHAEIAAKLRRGLERNYEGKVLMPYLGAKRTDTNIFETYLLSLPEGIPAEGIEAGLRNAGGALGLAFPEPYQDQIVPWFESIAANVLALMGDGRAFEHLAKAARITSTLGAFPERIRPDGYWIGFYYTTPSAAYAWAVNNMLAHSRGDTVTILPAVPPEWADLSFENLRLQPGLLVSAEARGGRLARLSIRNDSPSQARFDLRVPEPWRAGMDFPPSLTLTAGETWEK